MISIIIVNWNTRELLEKCLSSLFFWTTDIDFEIIVVDNNSADNSCRMVAEKFQAVKLIKSEINLGFAKANNLGLKSAVGEYLLFLNPDTELIENSVKKLVELMENNSRWGIAGSKILNPNKTLQQSVRGFPDGLSQLLITLNIHKIFPRLPVIRKYLMVDFDYNNQAVVDQVMGAVFMTRKKVLEQIGGWDENFRLWFEEVDLCYRAKKAGWLVVYTPATAVIHHGGASFSQARTYDKQKVFSRSLLYFFKKHGRIRAYWFNLLLTPFRLGLGKVASVFERKKKI